MNLESVKFSFPNISKCLQIQIIRYQERVVQHLLQLPKQQINEPVMANYLQHARHSVTNHDGRQADSQLHPHQLTTSQDSSRSNLALQVPSNTFERAQQQQQQNEGWPQTMGYGQQQQQVHYENEQNQPQPTQYSGKAGMSLNLHNETSATIGSSQRNSSAKHSHVQRSQDPKAGGGFFGAGSAEVNENGQDSNTATTQHYLNKTQIIVDTTKSSINERANRINLHRSNRQRSHQSNNGTQNRGQEGTSAKQGDDGVADLSIKLKNKGSNLDVSANFYQQPVQSDSVKNSSQHYRYAQPGEESEVDGSKSQLQQQENQQQYYHTQHISNSKVDYQQQQQQQQPQNLKQPKDHHSRTADGQDQISQQSRQQQQSYAPNYKKKVQPHQPRPREESRRKGAGGVGSHNKSSETTNSWEQSSQNSSQCQQQQVQQQQQQNTYQGHKQVDTDKFSQLVCQVPQGKTSPQMAQQAQQHNNLVQVHDGSMNFGNQYLLGPQRPNEQGRKTLVLDLDETLVHSSFKPVEGADIMLPVEIDGQICTIYVLVRPYVAQFLKSLHKIYELVIFTASLSKYAEPLMSHLDPGKMCSYLLFREHCTYFNNAYVKDLTRLGRPMKDVIIVDNSPVAYLFQPENAIPAVSWYDEPSDMELQRIAILLERLNQEDDVRKIIRSVIQNNKIDPRQEQLYLASAQHRRDKSQQVTRRSKHQKLTSNEMSGVVPQQTQVHHSDQALQSAAQVQKVQQVNYQQEQDPSQIQLRNHLQQQQQPNGHQTQAQGQPQNQTAQPTAQSHSRYDSSDTRQRNAAMISEQLNQRKHCDSDNLNMEIVLSNVQKLTQQTKDLQYESELKKSMHQNSKDIQQAYQHHKNQILQLQNEIAALKSQHTTTSDQTPRNQATSAKGSEVVVQKVSSSRQQQQAQHQTQQNAGKSQSKTTGQAQRVMHQQIGDNSQLNEPRKVSPVKQGNKGQKQRGDTGNTRVQQATYEGQTSTVTTKPSAARQQRQSYKVLSSNEIQLVNYIKSGGNTQINNNSGSNTTNQRHPVHGGGEKKQIVVRESAGNNSQLHNTKQIIKLIKKTEGHQSNIDVSNSARKNFQNLEPSSTTAAQSHQVVQASQPNIIGSGPQQQANYSSRQQHPATTKSQSKGHFAFSQQQAQPTSNAQHHDRQRVTQQSSGQPFSGQINMMTSSHGQNRVQQASRTSSKTTKNYSVANQGGTNGTGNNLRTSYSSSKNAKPAGQSSLQTHDRITAGNVVVAGAAGTTKRSSSVKSPVTSTHHGHRKGSNGEQAGRDHNVRKSNNTLQNGASSQAYGNLVSSYDQQPNGHHRRERGSSAQPLYTGSNHSGNPLLVTNLVARPSSTTNKNKKVSSISGTGNFHNLVLNGSHSTKHSTQHVSGQGASQPTGQQRGGSQDRHQKASSTTRHSSRVKGSTTNTTKASGHHHGHHGQNQGSDTKEEQQVRGSSKQNSQQYNLKQQQEHLQRMQQMTTSGTGGNVKQQLSVTQRISPGTMLSLTTGGQQYVNNSGQGQSSQNQLLDASLTPSNHQQHASALVKQNMKDIQVQDMLRLTQNTNAQGPPGSYFNSGMSSTRNSKQVAQIAGNTSMQQPGPDDFLKKVKMQQQAGVKTVPINAEMQQRHDGGAQEKPSSKQGNVVQQVLLQHQEVAQSKSSQGHQSTGPSLSIKSPKYHNGNVPGSQTCASAAGGSQRDQQKILNDIMNMAVQREQKSGSAATNYGQKQVVMTSVGGGQANTGGHQIKKIRISSTQQGQNGRMSGQSNQSAPNHHKSTGMKRGESNQSRGSHSGAAIHQVVRSSGNGQVKSRANEKDPHARQAHMFNQTMKLKDTLDNRAGGGNRNGGIISLLNELGEEYSAEQDKNSTAADLFLKSHNNPDQFSQTQYFGSGGNGTAANQGQNQMGQSQLREVTRHFYNQLAHAGGKKQQH